jgi:sulfate adenylyltransferase large subunit
MVTAASTASLALILIDARKGVIEQTRRHAYIASLLRIPHFAICVNKMDLVDFSQDEFEKIKSDFLKFAESIWTSEIDFIPMSALKGDNIVSKSQQMSWYQGPALLEYLEKVEVGDDRNLSDGRFPVQYVIRPRDDQYHDFRGYAGRIASGVFEVGQQVCVLPSGKQSTIKAIHDPLQEVRSSFAGRAVTIRLEDEIDISRGDLIVPADNAPQMSDKLQAKVCWMSDDPLWPNRKYMIKLGTNSTKAIAKRILSRVDINTLEDDTTCVELKLNDIGSVEFQLARPTPLERYENNKALGGFIIIDEVSNY